MPAEEEEKAAKVNEEGKESAVAQKNQVDLDDEAELAKLIKDEDINVVPENTDVSEIDKLTGVPKNNGK